MKAVLFMRPYVYEVVSFMNFVRDYMCGDYVSSRRRQFAILNTVKLHEKKLLPNIS